MYGKAFEILLNIGFIDLGENSIGVLICYYMVLLSFGDHVAQPLFTSLGVEIESEGTGEDIVQFFSGESSVRKEAMQSRRQHRKRQMEHESGRFLCQNQGFVVCYATGAMPEDEFFRNPASYRSAEIIEVRKHCAIMLAIVRAAGKSSHEPPQQRDDSHQKEYERRQSIATQAVCRSVIDDVAHLPAGHGVFEYRGP